jgi:uncharacterized repeat protein (TIGR04138 family)
MQTVSFEEVLDKIVAADPRYSREAYHFIREALDYTQKKIVRAPKDEFRHVTGQQLLEGIRAYALEQFGPRTITVLEEWGIRNAEAFGDLVFNMVESSLLAKTEHDTRDDFKNSYEFEEAFRKPFLPQRPLRRLGLPVSAPVPRSHAD